MKIAVTGALGHIGSALIRALPASLPGAEVVLVDNLSTQRYCSLFDLPDGGAYRFVEADIVRADLEPVLAGADAVIHLAAITDAAGSFEIRDRVEEVNLTGGRRVAEACARVGAALLFPSTTSVYGTQRELVDEDCAPEELKPQSPYAESKLRAEQMLVELGALVGLRWVTCRFGTIFGTSPGMRFHTAVNKFCWQAVMGQPLTVWRTAMDQKRPYLYLGDAVRAVTFILTERAFDGRVYNVVTDNASVRQLVDYIRPHVPDVTVEYVDTPIMNQLSYEVSNARFRKLGFEVSGTLEAGIGETIRLFGGLATRGR
jgi:UDP-glucose 4-epimerase